MMTPERSTVTDDDSNMIMGGAAPFVGSEGTPFINDDLESQDTSLPNETMQDEPSAVDINNSLNTSVSSENCKIINESDVQQHSPCPDPEGVTTVNVMNGVMNGNEVVPVTANLTPVKLDAGLKEQDTFTSSPSNSNDLVGVNDHHHHDESSPLSRRQQRMRIVKCYGAVAVIILVLAIGIPLGAVMIFKSSSTETSFATGANEGNNSPSTTITTVTTVPPNDMRPPQEPPIVEEEEEEDVTEVPNFHHEDTEPPKEITEVPEEVIEDLDDADGTTDPPVFEEDPTTQPPIFEEETEQLEIEDVDDEDGTTDAPFFQDEADTESPFFVVDELDTEAPFVPPTDPVATDAPITVDSDANVTDLSNPLGADLSNPFGEGNITANPNVTDARPEAVTTEAPEAVTEAPDAMTEAPDAMTEAPDAMTEAPDAPEVVTDPPVIVTAAPTTATPTSSPTWSPTWSPTATPTVTETVPQTPPTTAGPDRSVVYFDLINVTSPAVLQDMTTPQAISYLWLVEKDQILPVPSGRYLLQRYILVVMDHVLHDPLSTSISQPMLDHCLWDGVVCDLESGDVKEINWRLHGLNGRLVEEIKHLDSLERLDLSENDLFGNLDYLYGATSLRHVYLHDNKFSGMLTEQVGQMEMLESLYLGHNELTGYIPLSLRSSRGGAKPLKWLILSHNKFTGYLPPDWRMRNLFHLDLGHNMLSGPLPNDWDVNMVRLRHLYLDHNQFTGLLPAYFGQLGNGRLKQLYLNDNLLEGKVPENWDPLDQLTNMAVHNNNLTVPVSARVCEMSVFELGVMVELRTDCDICTCDFLCEMCVE